MQFDAHTGGICSLGENSPGGKFSGGISKLGLGVSVNALGRFNNVQKRPNVSA